MNVREELFKLKDEQYKEFLSKLTKSKYPIIGVKVPLIKKLAKGIGVKEEYFFSEAIYLEEIMLEGLLIGYLKDIDKVLKELDFFVNKIDDWSICDSVCSSLKITNKYKDIVWDFINKYKNSEKEFEVRFMIVMMLHYYLEDNYIDRIFDILDDLKCDAYYAKMAVAWLLATSVVKCEEKTLNYLKKSNLDKFTFNKMISKCNDSYRVNNDLKKLLKEMKK